ncbi:MAG: ABC transporter ATP-binding protein, partial [Planctomycetes bacterium]|nr:ABC transporter ATP-binding protein [Planctomycetota bacterium]
MAAPLLQVEHLCKRFPLQRDFLGRARAWKKAVEDVGFSVDRGRTYALVGESGCGKTTTGRCVLRLIEPTSGRVLFDGVDVAALGKKELARARRRMQMIFQDPFSSLNPRFNVGAIVSEGWDIHGLVPKAERPERLAELFRAVGLLPEYLSRYPHEFSGGQRQRVGIARALALSPDFIVCDEAVSALDVSIQAQIVNLLIQLQEERGIAYLFISHDLAVVRHISLRVGVMYAGRLVEEAATDDLFAAPAHPYTRMLLSAIPT